MPGIDRLLKSGETGYLVQNRNSAEFALAVEKVIEDPQRAKSMGKAAQQLVARHYNIEHSVDVLAQIYLSILSACPDRGRVHAKEA